MRTAEYMGVLFRSGLVQFGSQGGDGDDATTRSSASSSAGRAKGPIGMDEMAQDEGEIEASCDRATTTPRS